MPKDKDQEVFVEPEFNKRDFLTSEKDRAKATIVVFLLAAALGLASGYLFIIGIWYVGVLIMVLLMVFFKRLLTFLHLKIPKVNNHLILMFLVFFLTWIIFWTVALNAPLHSAAGVEVKDVQYHFTGGNFTSVSERNGYYSIPISQNDCVTSFRILVSYVSPLTNVSLTGISGQSHYSDGWLYFNESLSYGGSSSEYTFTVTTVVNNVYYNEPINIKVIQSSS